MPKPEAESFTYCYILILNYFQTPNFAPGKSVSRIMKNGSLMAPTVSQKHDDAGLQVKQKGL